MAAPRARKRFGEEVRHLIAERRMTLRGLAAKAGVDPGFLVRVLQEKQPPSKRLLDGVSEALDLPPDYFVEVRREKLSQTLLRSPAFVDAIYNQLAPGLAVDISRGRANPEAREPLNSPLTILTFRDATDPRLVQLGAAALVRYQTDDDFRAAVDEQLPDMERLAQELEPPA